MSSQTVLVTGATSGIGAEVARQFVARGHRVYGTTRNPDAVRHPIAGVTYVRLDNADYDSATACADLVGPVDILVNNAGESQAGALEDTSMQAIEDLFRVNVFGPIALTKAVLPGMRERRRGTVVMVGSMLSSFPVAFRSNYAATKSALKAFALATRREVAPYGIRMISVEPGTIATGIGDRRSIHVARTRRTVPNTRPSPRPPAATRTPGSAHRTWPPRSSTRRSPNTRSRSTPEETRRESCSSCAGSRRAS